MLLFQDTHTIDLSEFQASHTNITLLRLVDPEDATVQRVVRFWTEKEEYYSRSLGVTAQNVRVCYMLYSDKALSCKAAYISPVA
jgi:hypothetical protein